MHDVIFISLDDGRWKKGGASAFEHERKMDKRDGGRLTSTIEDGNHSIGMC